MFKPLKKEIVSVLVENQANVLTRVVSMFGRRGFNIDSLTVSATNDPNLSRENSLYRELLLIKIGANQAQRSAIKEIVDIFRGKIVDLSKESLIVELTGTPEKLDGFMDVIEDYNVLEVCRTGITGIESHPLK